MVMKHMSIYFEKDIWTGLNEKAKGFSILQKTILSEKRQLNFDPQRERITKYLGLKQTI